MSFREIGQLGACDRARVLDVRGVKFPFILATCSVFAAIVLSSCGSRGGLAAEEEAVPPDAHEMKQFRRAELEDRREGLGWR